MSLYGGGGTVVDSKVVELKMENGQFEQNAETSLKTIEKINKSLDMVGDTKGIEGINDSLKNISFDALNNGVDTARRGFSLLETVTFGFFGSLGAKIENTAAELAKLFTGFDAFADGFKEYELKMDSVQTILMGAKTAEGLPVTLDLVNQKLEELNAYSDKTIYSFKDMTANIGKFTNAGVDLDTAVAAIQGISNEAALSGANAAEASRAMYNFSQALASGAVKLIDWKSIENANMATVEFKQTLIDTAGALGTIKETSDGMYEALGSGKSVEAFNATTKFNDSLSNLWMTTDVLTETLAQYSDETTNLGRRAFEAATKVKTFSQLMDTLKEAAGSGWAYTFEILIGDFEQARNLFTFLSNEIGGVIGDLASERNDALKEAMGAPPKIITKEMFESLDLTTKETYSLADALMKVGEKYGQSFGDYHSLHAFKESLESGWLTADMLKEALGAVGESGETAAAGIDKIQEAALAVIRGDYGNDMEARFKQLEEAGLDPQLVQDYVNRIHELAGGTWNVTDAMLAQADSEFEAQAGLAKLSDEQLESMGYTKEQIENLRRLAEQVNDSNTAIGKLADNSDAISNRTKILMSLQGIIRNFIKLGGVVKQSFEQIFPPSMTEIVTTIADGFLAVATNFDKFVLAAMAPGSDLRNILTGIFSILKFGIGTLNVVFNIALKIVTGVLGAVLPILGKILGIAGKIVTFIGLIIDIINPGQIVMDAFGAATEFVANKFKGFLDTISKSAPLKHTISMFKLAGKTFKNDFIPHINATKEKWGEFVTRFKEKGGLKNAFSSWSNFKDAVKDFKSTVIDYFLKFPGFKMLKVAFDSIGRSIKDILVKNGVPVDKIEAKFKNLGGTLVGIKDKLKTSFDSLATTVKQSSKLKTVTSAFKDAGTAIKNGFVPHLKEVRTRWNLFRSNLEEKGGLKAAFSSFDSVKETFGDFKSLVLDQLLNFPGFEKLKTAFKTLGDSIRQELIERGVPVEKIEAKFAAFGETVGGLKDKVKSSFESFTKSAKVKKITDAFKTAGDTIKKGLTPHLTNVKSKWDTFVDGVKQSGGIKAAFGSFDSIRDTFSNFKTQVLDYLLNFKGFDQLKTAFKTLGDTVRTELIDRGFPVEKIEGFFGTIWGYISGVGEKIKNFFLNFINSEEIQADLEKVKGGFRLFWASLPVFGQKLGAAWDDFLARVQDLGGFKFENIGDIFTAFQETIGAEFENFTGFDGLKKAFGSLWEDIKAQLKDSTGIDLDGIKQKIVEFIDGVSEDISNFSLPDALQSVLDFVMGKIGIGNTTETNVPQIISDTGEAIASASEKIEEKGDTFLSFFSDLWETLSNLSIVQAITELFTGMTVYADELDEDSSTFATTTQNIQDGAENAEQKVGSIKESLGGLVDVIKEKLSELIEFVLGHKDEIIAIGTTLAGIVVALKIFNLISGAGEYLEGKGKQFKAEAILTFTKAIGRLAVAMVVLSQVKDFDKAALRLIGLGAILIGFSKAMEGMELGKLGASAGMLIAFAIAVGVITAALFVLASLPMERVWSAAGALALVVGVLGGITALLGETGTAGFGAAFQMAITIGAVAAALGILASIENADKLIPTAAALAIVLGSLAVTMAALAVVQNYIGEIKRGTIIQLVVVLGAVSLALGLLSKFADVDSLIPIAESLAKVLIAVGAAMALIAFGEWLGSKAGAGGATALAGAATTILSVIGIIALIALILGVVEEIPVVGDVVKTALDNAIEVMGKIGELFGALVGGAVGGFFSAAAEGGSAFFDALPGIGQAISDFMTNLSAIQGVEIDIKPFAQALLGIAVVSAVNVVGALADFINSNSTFWDDLGGMASSIVTFMTNLQDLNNVENISLWKLTQAVGTLTTIAFEDLVTSVGQFLRGGAKNTFFTDLADTATNIVGFMTNLKGLNDVGTVRTRPLQQAIETISKIAWTDLLSSISDFISGGADGGSLFPRLPGIGRSIYSFMEQMKKLEDLGEVDLSSLSGAIEAVIGVGWGEFIASLGSKANEALTGKTSAEQFAEDIGGIADAIGTWQEKVDSLKGEDGKPIEIDTSAIDQISAAIRNVSFTSIVSAVADVFTGDTKSAITTFERKIEQLGRALQKAHDLFDDMPNLNFDADAVPTLTAAIEAIPKSGGLLDAIKLWEGDSDFSGFEQDSASLAAALNKFADALGDDLDVDRVKNAAEAANNLAEMVDALGHYVQNSGGSLVYTVTNFADELPGLAENINAYVGKINNITDANQATMIAKVLAESASTLSTIKFDESDLNDSSKVTLFKGNVETLVNMFNEMSGKDFTGADKFKEAVDTLNQVDLKNEETEVKAEVKVDTSSSSTAGENATEAFSQGVSGMADAAKTAASDAASAIGDVAGEFTTAGLNMIVAFANGIINNAFHATAAGIIAGSRAASAAENTSGAEIAGMNFIRGYANGITTNTAFVVNAATMAVNRAIDAANEAQKSRSPSRVTYKIGKWFVEGYANAIRDHADLAVNASTGMVDETRKGLKNAVDRINSILSDEMDTTPTITPVLDLTELQNGAAGIGDLLTADATDMNGALAAISGGVSRRTTNYDILSALTALRGSVDSRANGDTYNINGITYDDGSNVADAVTTLVRAVRVGRRV